MSNTKRTTRAFLFCGLCMLLSLIFIRANGGKLQDRVDNLEPKILQLEGRVKTLEATLNGMGNKVTILDSRVATLENTEVRTVRPVERWGILAGLAASFTLSVSALGAVTLFNVKLKKKLKEIQDQRDSVTPDPPDAGKKEEATSEGDLMREFKTALADLKRDILAEIEKLPHTANPVEPPIKESPQIVASSESIKELGDGGVSPRLIYPASVEDCLTRLQDAKVTLVPVRPDVSLFGNLSQADDNRFWLAEESGDHSECLVFPKARRFGSDQEFYTYYQNYYECADPSAGEVLILEPGIVVADEAQGGWKLMKKGRLEVA